VMHHDADHLTLTQEGMMVGSYYYVSPEQLDGQRDVDNRADIYSLGGTLYHALTGRTAFAGKSPQEIVTQTLAGNWVSPRRYNHTVSAATVRLLKRMMARNRDRRHATMAAVVKEIDAILRPRRWKRHLLLALAAAALLLAGLLLEHFVVLIGRF